MFNINSICHPERSRSFFERGARKNRGATRRRDLQTILGGFCINVTSHQQATEICYEIPLRLKPRASACSLTLNPQKFDSAQDDKLIIRFIIIVKSGRPMVAPTMDFEVLQNAFPSFRLKTNNIFCHKKSKKGLYKSALLWYT